MDGWKNYTERLEKLNDQLPEARGYLRVLLSGASDVGFDKLGRILIPDYLKEYAGLKKNITIIGLSNKIEIWDKEAWDKYRKKTEGKLGDMASKLKELEN